MSTVSCLGLLGNMQLNTKQPTAGKGTFHKAVLEVSKSWTIFKTGEIRFIRYTLNTYYHVTKFHTGNNWTISLTAERTPSAIERPKVGPWTHRSCWGCRWWCQYGWRCSRTGRRLRQSSPAVGWGTELPGTHTASCRDPYWSHQSGSEYGESSSSIVWMLNKI